MSALRRNVALVALSVCACTSSCGSGERAASDDERTANRAQALATAPLAFTAASSPQLSYAPRSAALSGDTLAVGLEMGLLPGGVMVYVWSGTAWTQQQSITPADGANDDDFGQSVALSGDTLLVGVPGKDVGGYTDAGRVDVYTRSQGAWTLRAHVTPTDARASWGFGSSVAFDVDTFVATASNSQVYIFGGAATSWTQQAKLTGAKDDLFGSSVDVSGDRVIVGAPYRNAVFGGPRSGSAWIFSRANGPWQIEQELYAVDGSESDTFGTSVALDGTTAVVGAPSRKVVSNYGGDGVAYVFDYASGIWGQSTTSIVSPAYDNSATGFGRAVALDGDLLIVTNAKQYGHTSILQRDASGWSERLSTTAWAGAPALSGRLAVWLSGDTVTTYAGRTSLGAACASDADCTSGHCADGVCCDAACGGSAIDCQACSVAAGATVDGTCTMLPSTRVCRASKGGCDPAEVCDGQSPACPEDEIAGAGATCRAAAGACDVAETCDGVSVACPPDVVVASGTECRTSKGECDVAEACDGQSPACPNDDVAAPGTVCRPAAAACDAAEVCDGRSVDCPVDAVRSFGEVCRAAVGACDAPEICDGASSACPADALAPEGTVCRAAAYACDQAEACDGTTAVCPPNGLAPNGSACDDGDGCTSNDHCESGACKGTDVCHDEGRADAGDNVDAGGDGAPDAGSDVDDAGADATTEAGSDAADRDAEPAPPSGAASGESGGGCSASGRGSNGGAPWGLAGLAFAARAAARRRTRTRGGNSRSTPRA